MNNRPNPIPSVDDEPQSRTVRLGFTFERPVTTKEAADILNEWLKNNDITPEKVALLGNIGIKYAEPQPRLGVNDRDPNGYGPR